MAYSFTEKKRIRKNFGKQGSILETPYLLAIQLDSYKTFLQADKAEENRVDIGLHAAFKTVFPITSYSGNATLEYVSYRLGDPVFDVKECQLRGLTYAAPLRVKVRLVVLDKEASGPKKPIKDVREQEVYVGELPLMTDRGTFIVNGTERVVVSQLHRSPGVFFSHDKGKTHVSGRLLYSARVIPSRGSWLDFEFDTKDILYVRIDRRRKLPATIVLKALGYSNEDLLKIFYPVEAISISGNKYTRSVSEILVGIKSAMNIMAADTKELIVKEGSKITRGAVRKMEASGIKTIPISKEEIIGRITLKDIIDPATGEVVLEGNEVISEDAFNKMTIKLEWDYIFKSHFFISSIIL